MFKVQYNFSEHLPDSFYSLVASDMFYKFLKTKTKFQIAFQLSKSGSVVMTPRETSCTVILVEGLLHFPSSDEHIDIDQIL